MKQSEQHDFLIESLNLEFKTIKAMVVIYCRDKHQSASLCDECEDFLAYAHTRLDRCPHGGSKPTCKLCPIHCYKADYKARSKEIMRYAGPKMLFRHPYLAIRHLMAGKKEVEPKPPANASNRHMRVAKNKIDKRN